MEKRIMSLEMVEICVTSRCNLECSHCYQHHDKNHHELAYEKLIEIVSFASSRNCQEYVLSGGEFFLHERAYDLLDYIFENTTCDDIKVVTNLSMADTDRISAYPRERIEFLVSVYGSPEAHDKRRGQGHYEKVAGKINELSQLGFRVSAICALDEENFTSLNEVLENPIFNEITILPVAPVGAAGMKDIPIKDSSEYADVLKCVYHNCHVYHDSEARCSLFPNGFSVKYNGDIFPCNLARDYGLGCIGNVSHKHIDDVISAFTNSDESNMYFEYKANSQVDECNNCPENKVCNRGCRIRALKFNNKLLSSDPFVCKIFTTQHEDIPFGTLYWGEAIVNELAAH